MQVFLLLLMLSAVMLIPRRRAEEPPPEPQAVPIDWTAFAALLAVPLDALRELMDHPQLGGPGFLTVQFPLSGTGTVEVSAQYPNIQETLYRLIRTAGPDELIAAGVPAVLFEYRAAFTPESGGMVLITADAFSLPAGIRLEDRQERQTVLQQLARILGERYPDMTVRAIGGDLLLTPVREKDGDM